MATGPLVSTPSAQASAQTIHDSYHPANSPSVTDTVISDYLHEKKAPDALHQLSSRERHVLQMLVEGKSAASVARKLHLSPRTIETYKARLMRKLGLSDLPALVKFAVRHGLTPLD